jgi:hypothetical protein
VQRLPWRGKSPRRFIGPPPLSLALRAICNMKNVRLAFHCLWVPKTPGGGTRLEIGAFYHRLSAFMKTNV